MGRSSEDPREVGEVGGEVIPLKTPGVELFPSLHLGQQDPLPPSLQDAYCVCVSVCVFPCLCEGGGRLWPFIHWAETPLCLALLGKLGRGSQNSNAPPHPAPVFLHWAKGRIWRGERLWR